MFKNAACFFVVVAAASTMPLLLCSSLVQGAIGPRAERPLASSGRVSQLCFQKDDIQDSG